MTESTQSLHEALSAAMDDEAEELELRRVLNAARQDPQLSAKWQRLHAVQEAMRSGSGAMIATNGLRRPWLQEPAAGADAALDVEQPASQQVERGGKRRIARGVLQGLTASALAAAVAFGVVLYFGDSPAPAKAPAAALAPAASASSRTLAQVPSETDLRRANVYMLQHAQNATLDATLPTRPAVMPFAKALAVRQPNADANWPTGTRRNSNSWRDDESWRNGANRPALRPVAATPASAAPR